MKTMITLLLALYAVPALAGNYLIHAGAMFDSISGEMRTRQSIRVAGNEISAVEAGYLAPGDAEGLIDLKDATVMPGLMDMHVHLCIEIGADTYIERFTLNPGDYAYRCAFYARRTLDAGFTTVRNLGDTDNLTIALRNAIAKGFAVGPRIYTAGKTISVTGGHGDPTNGYRHDLMGDPGPRQGVINGPVEARKAVRQRYKDGADVIKITSTAGVMSLAKNSQSPQFLPDELEAVVEVARDYEMVVAAHAHGTEGLKRAVRAGVDSIEHGTFLDEEGIRLMKEHGTYLVPTLSPGYFITEKAKIDGYFPEMVRRKAFEVGKKAQESAAEAYRQGVNIAFGTDSGVTPHGDNAEEFQWMVEIGIEPRHALQSATLHAARLLEVEDKLGSIAVGKFADIVAVTGNPLEDITVMSKVIFVMKDGEVFKR